MIHPLFFNFVEKCGRFKVTVSTNGHFLTGENSRKLAESCIKKLIISLDGMNDETYSRYRVGGDLKKVIAGIRDISKELSRVRSSMKFEIQFLVNRYNESQIPAAEQFAKEVRANLKLKSMQIINYKESEKWLPGDEKFRRYKVDKDGILTPKNSYKKQMFEIMAEPCCYLGRESYTMLF